VGRRIDTIRFECPHCKDINRSLVVTLSCRRGSSTVLRTRKCLKCLEIFYTQEKALENHSEIREDLKKSLTILDTKVHAQITVLKNKLNLL